MTHFSNDAVSETQNANLAANNDFHIIPPSIRQQHSTEPTTSVMLQSNQDCPLCLHPKVFTEWSAYRDAFVSLTTRNFPCPICLSSVQGVDKFALHLVSHDLRAKILTSPASSSISRLSNTSFASVPYSPHHKTPLSTLTYVLPSTPLSYPNSVVQNEIKLDVDSPAALQTTGEHLGNGHPKGPGFAGAANTNLLQNNSPGVEDHHHHQHMFRQEKSGQHNAKHCNNQPLQGSSMLRNADHHASFAGQTLQPGCNGNDTESNHKNNGMIGPVVAPLHKNVPLIHQGMFPNNHLINLSTTTATASSRLSDNTNTSKVSPGIKDSLDELLEDYSEFVRQQDISKNKSSLLLQQLKAGDKTNDKHNELFGLNNNVLRNSTVQMEEDDGGNNTNLSQSGNQMTTNASSSTTFQVLNNNDMLCKGVVQPAFDKSGPAETVTFHPSPQGEAMTGQTFDGSTFEHENSSQVQHQMSAPTAGEGIATM